MLCSVLMSMLDALMAIPLCSIFCEPICFVGVQEKLFDNSRRRLCGCHNGQARFKHAAFAQTIAYRLVTSRDLLMAYR